MKKKLIVLLILAFTLIVSAIGLVACGEQSETAEDYKTTEIYAVYKLYAASEEGKGNSPLSYEQWLLMIKGEKGEKGDQGERGADGTNGKNGENGTNGVGIAKIEKTFSEGLNDTYTITFTDGTTTTYTISNGKQGERGADGTNGTNGENGTNGKSAYEIWLDNGHTGTESDFLEWLKGEKGDQGERGADGTNGKDGENGTNGVGIAKIEKTFSEGLNDTYTITFTDGTTTTYTISNGKQGERGADGTNGENGTNGKSAYEIWLDNGHTGTESDFLEWLKGEKGNNGDNGQDGVGIENANIDENGNLIIVLTSGGEINAGKLKEVHGHEIIVEEIIDRQPTCQTKGIKYIACSSCGEILKAIVIPKIAHKYEEGVCTYCGKIKPISTDGIEFTLNQGKTGYSVTGYKGTATEVIIGYEYNDLPVTSIESGAFEYCVLTSITIPDSVTSIGDYAFSECHSLTSVTIGDGILSIGKYVFSHCSSLTSITIPDSVTSIGEYVFNHCDNLTSVTIGDGVLSIGDCAFECCGSLASVTIGGSVTSIGDYAFEGCGSLTSITIPGSVTSMGEDVFIGSGLKSVTIEDGVRSIGCKTFYMCSSLTSVTIGNSVTSIGREAFSGCSGLTSVYFNGISTAWVSISIEPYNSWFTDATRYYYSETEPTTDGNYWHYDTDGITPIVW